MGILTPFYFMAVLHSVREYLLTMPWGVMTDHLSLACIFETIEKNKANKINELYRSRVGSQITLINTQTLSSSLVTLTEPANSDPYFGKISYLSLLGSELLGAVSGQHIDINVLGRSIKFQVLDINNTQLTQRG